MSGKLVREVLDSAPADLTRAQLVVLLVIAERSQPRARTVDGRVIGARECFPEREDMHRDCRMTEDTLSKTLQRLARRGLEVRVPLGTDKSGRPYYARSGHRTTYRLPVFEARPDHSPGWIGRDDVDDRKESPPTRTAVRPEGGHLSGHARTTVRAQGGPLSGPNRNVTGTEPEGEPTDPWRDRGQRAASAAAILTDERSEVDVEDLLDEVEHRVRGFDGAEESTARGMLSSGSAVQLIVNTIGANRRDSEVAQGAVVGAPDMSDAVKRIREQTGGSA